MKEIDRDNVNNFIGLICEGPTVMSVWKECPKGTLSDMLARDTMNLDWFFKYALIRDVAEVGRLTYSVYGGMQA